jgi:hypothetical protein
MTRNYLVALAPVRLAQVPGVPAPWANKLFLPDVAKNPSQPAPPVVAHDFGTVPHGTLCVHKFTLTNIYDAPMQVTEIVRSCGCLEAYPPQKVLQANESAEFVVTMNTAKFSGSNTQTIYVKLGPTYQSTAVLRMTAVSRADVQLLPGQVNFGTVAVGAKPTQTVALEYNGRQRDWKVTGVVPPSGPIEVEVKETSRGWVGGAKYAVNVSLKPEAIAGPLSEVIALKTNDPAAPVVHVNVVGVIQAPLTLSTSSVRFEKVKVGSTAMHKVVIRAASGPFKIDSVSDEGDGISVETFPAASPVQIVTVKFAPTKAGGFRKELRLKTDLGGGAIATLVVEADAVTE